MADAPKPYEKLEVRDTDYQKGREASKLSWERFMEWLEWQTPRLAMIVGSGQDYEDDTTKDETRTSYADEFVVDIYDNGYFAEPTKRGILTHNVDPTLTFGPDYNGNWGQQIKVSLLPDGTGLILPSHLPNATGRYKVMMIGDDSFPGTWITDYPRFT